MKKIIAVVLALGTLATVLVFSANASTSKPVDTQTGFVADQSNSRSVVDSKPGFVADQSNSRSVSK